MQLARAPRRLAIGKLLLAPLVVGYRLGIVPATLVRASIVRFAFGGVAEEGISSAGEAFARDTLPQLGAQCVGMEKCRRVREHYDVAGFPKVYAYGDASEDLTMLQMADEGCFRWQKTA